MARETISATAILLLCLCVDLTTAARHLTERGDRDPGPGQASHGLGAVYTQTNDPDRNCIVAIPFDMATSTLSPDMATTTYTGGRGSPGTASDRLFSQGAVKVSGGLLFAVNAGSNTLSVFRIGRRDPTDLKLLGAPAPTMGDFPVSIDYSPRTQTACALNGGTVNGVTCFKVHPSQGLMQRDVQVRTLTASLTTPPAGPPSTYSQVLFNPDGSQLVVLFKGSPGSETSASTPGVITTYMVDDAGMLSASPVTSFGPGLLFGSVFTGPTTLVVSEPISVVQSYQVAADGSAKQTAQNPISGTRAVCWAAYSALTRTVLLADAGQPILTQVDTTLAVTQRLDLSAAVGAAGLFDIEAPGPVAYALIARTGAIVAVDVSGGAGAMRLRQITPTGVNPPGGQGLAVYPAEPSAY